MSTQTKAPLLARLRQHARSASPQHKSLLLDQAVELPGYHPEPATCLPTGRSAPWVRGQQQPAARPCGWASAAAPAPETDPLAQVAEKNFLPGRFDTGPERGIFRPSTANADRQNMKKLILTLMACACAFSVMATGGQCGKSNSECPAKKGCGDKGKGECPKDKKDGKEQKS